MPTIGAIGNKSGQACYWLLRYTGEMLVEELPGPLTDLLVYRPTVNPRRVKAQNR